MTRIAACCLVAALAVVALSPSALADGPPPRDLRLEGDHWTAWDPPTPPEGANVYVIAPGDTLWDLAARLLGDPYLWPQIWEQNRYILDAHWIYPGDPLLLGPAVGGAVVGEAGVAGDPIDQADLEDPASADDPFGSIFEDGQDSDDFDPAFAGPGMSDGPVPLGSESDIYCSGYVGGLEEEFPFSIAASEYEFLSPELDPQRDSELKGLYGRAATAKYGLSTSDIIYLDGGRADGLAAGELLTVIEPGELIEHPTRGDVLGRYYDYKARVRVLSVQEETAIAEIVAACDPVTVGSMLRLFEPEPVPLRRRTPMRPLNFPAEATELEGAPSIVYSVDGLVTLGSGYLVFIDQGEAQDVLPGDVFTIYRPTSDNLPPIVLGELGILSVQENSALANILESRYSIYIGDLALIK
ncbi:MAG: LysM peptidoglycan-binding domain-containing protein [Acidobacteriota bacterium]